MYLHRSLHDYNPLFLTSCRKKCYNYKYHTRCPFICLWNCEFEAEGQRRYAYSHLAKNNDSRPLKLLPSPQEKCVQKISKNLILHFLASCIQRSIIKILLHSCIPRPFAVHWLPTQFLYNLIILHYIILYDTGHQISQVLRDRHNFDVLLPTLWDILYAKCLKGKKDV